MGIDRKQLAKFLPDHESVRQFEKALKTVGDTEGSVAQLTNDLAALTAEVGDIDTAVGVAQAAADAAQATADTAVTNAATAQATADTAVTNAATAQSTANTAASNAAAAQSTANTAVSNAATAQSTANTAVANAATAQGTANTAVTNAATAQSTANTAVSNAAAAQSTANTALSNAATAQGEIDAHEALTAAHGATGAVVGTTNTQTLTNKTLDAAVLSGVTNLTGGRIQFPATQTASSDPNTLDDYEEGTYTPVATPQSGSITAYTANGSYVKVGRMVNATFDVFISNAGTGTGFLTVTLPFNAGVFPVVGCGLEGIVTNNMLVCAAGSSTPGSVLVKTYNNGAIVVTNAYVYCNVTYYV